MAPRLLLASHCTHDIQPSQEQQQLGSELQQLIQMLQPHADKIRQQSEAASSGLLAWGFGAGLYAEYYQLRVQSIGYVNLQSAATSYSQVRNMA